MRVKNVNIKNFLSIENIDINLDREGLNLVLGHNADSKQFDSNGSGKSSLFDAIVWCLYGEVLRNVSVDFLVRTGEKDMGVSVVVDPEDGTPSVIISRSRKLNKKSTLVVQTEGGKILFPSNSIIDMQEPISV
jgi:DNA repair exonuclease SbcCD ATPase subunit